MRAIINKREVTVDQGVLEGFKELLKIYSPSCVVADSQEREGVMRSYIRPLMPNTRFVGPALTVHLQPGNQVDCLDALSVAMPGDVIVVDAGGETETSIWGGLMAGLCKMKGVVGAVVDGAIRDVDEIRDLGFFIFSKAIVPRSTHSPYSGKYDPIEVNVPIQCGGVLVRPGDLILGDDIGVVVIPLENAEIVLKNAKEQARKEELTREKIRQGKTVEELLQEFGRL
ncbi:MAG: RraA family protein [Caldiserica bacterium]|nr:RraA family protein [Caldisericota bacterium]MDH7563195.1 RraA family protein [Caldisericota bacterium]